MVEAVIAMRSWLPVLLFCVFGPSSLFAHRLDEYLQATLVAIQPGRIELNINLTPGVAVADQVLALVDSDHDGVISTNETTAYAERLKGELTLRLDDRSLELKTAASESSGPTELRTGFGLIQITYTLSPGSLTAGMHRLTLENRHLPAISVYLFNAAQPASSTIQITAQKRNETQSTGAIEFSYQPPRSSPRVVGIILSASALFIALLMSAWHTVKHSPR